MPFPLRTAIYKMDCVILISEQVGHYIQHDIRSSGHSDEFGNGICCGIDDYEEGKDEITYNTQEFSHSYEGKDILLGKGQGSGLGVGTYWGSYRHPVCHMDNFKLIKSQIVKPNPRILAANRKKRKWLDS